MGPQGLLDNRLATLGEAMRWGNWDQSPGSCDLIMGPTWAFEVETKGLL